MRICLPPRGFWKFCAENTFYALSEIRSWSKNMESLSIEPLAAQNVAETLEFLREHFFPFEPCAVNIDLCPFGYKIPALEAMIQAIILEGLSIGAFSEGKLVGILINHEKKADDLELLNEEDQLKCNQLPEKFTKLDRFFTDLCTDYGRSSSFDALNISRIMDIFMLCTSQNASKKGIGSKLMKEAITIADKNGFKAIQCMALSLYTQKICIKQNYQRLFSIEYGKYSQDGKKFFNAESMGEHKEGILYILKL